jgi:amino acid adenylation domain-containing protein/FkbM family methyltransferase
MAYVIYTSGSTGRPKGVVNSHAALLNRVLWTQAVYPLGPGDVVLHKTPYSFDVSVWELLWPLAVGAKLVVARPDGHRDPAYLVDTIDREGVTLLHFVPSMLELFVESAARGRCASLRRVLCSGEALPQPLTVRFADTLGAELVNLYGPTEAAIDVCAWTCTGRDDDTAVPIGRPVWNTELHVLDGASRELPVGVTGELYIGGVQLARGYVGRPGMTAARFLPNPLAGTASMGAGSRIYRTGDLARRRADGALEYCGRNDHQVKLHGNRIELGEIESALRSHPAVREAAVVVRDEPSGDRRLVAYLVTSEVGGPSLDDAARASLQARLRAHPSVGDAEVIDGSERGPATAYIAPHPREAGAAARTLTLQAEGRLAPSQCHTLPNGLEVVQQNVGETAFLYREIFEDEGYSKHGVDVRDGDVFVDIGANIGMFSLYASTAARDVTVYSFEPIPPVCALLEMNAYIHGISGRVFPWALGAEGRTARFTYYARNTLMSGAFADAAEDREVVRALLRNETAAAADIAHVDLDELAARSQAETVQFECPVRTLTDVIREQRIERIDLLKIDVEKAEWEVLAGLGETDWDKVAQIVVEVHDLDGRLERTRALLESKGFRVTLDQDPMLAGTVLYSLFAVRPEAQASRAERTVTPVRSVGGPTQWLGELRASLSAFGSERVTWVPAPTIPRDATGAILRDELPAPPTPAEGTRIDVGAHLAARLPEYMIPRATVFLDALPLTANGKLDRKALPAPGRPARRARTRRAPSTRTERLLAEAWQRVLGVADVAVEDDFFELGGTSIGLARLAFRIREVSGREIAVRSLYQAPTIERQAALMDGEPRWRLEIPARQVGASVPLSFGQERILRWRPYAPGCTAYHIPSSLRIEGPLDHAAVERAVTAIVGRHEVLRSVYREVDGRVEQTFARARPVAVALVDLGRLAPPERTAAAYARAQAEGHPQFDLAAGTTMRCLLLRLAPDEHVFVVVWDHIVADNRAIEVFFRELISLLETGDEASLPALPFQYGDFAAWERRELEGPARQRLLDYWRPRIEGARPFEMLTDREPAELGPLASFPCAHVSWTVPTATRLALMHMARDRGTPLGVIVMSTLFAWLSRVSLHRDIAVTSSYHGRDHAETEQLFGYFARPLLLRADLGDDPSFETLIARIRDTVHGAYAHAAFPIFEMGDAPVELISRVHIVYQTQDASSLTGRYTPWLPLGTGRFRSRYMFIGVIERSEGLQLSIRYNTETLNESTVERLLERYGRLIEQIVRSPDLPVRVLGER